MRQIRKGGKSGREAILRVEKKHHKTVCESHRSVKYYQSYKVLTLAYAAGNNSKLVTDTKRSRSRQRSFIAFDLLNFINQEWKLLSS